VLGPSSTQNDAYLACGSYMVEAVVGGKNACLFTYGQTGSGKTHSVFGGEYGRPAGKLDGVVPQMVSELFRKKTQFEKRGKFRYDLKCSLVEVGSGSTIRDLLAKEDATALRMRGDDVLGARVEAITSSKQFMILIEQTMLKRTAYSVN
jgi:kinesin family member C1